MRVSEACESHNHQADRVTSGEHSFGWTIDVRGKEGSMETESLCKRWPSRQESPECDPFLASDCGKFLRGQGFNFEGRQRRHDRKVLRVRLGEKEKELLSGACVIADVRQSLLLLTSRHTQSPIMRSRQIRGPTKIICRRSVLGSVVTERRTLSETHRDGQENRFLVPEDPFNPRSEHTF